MPRVGDVEQDKSCDKAAIQQVALVAQAEIDEEVVCQQGQQIAVEETIAITLADLAACDLIRTEQKHGDNHRVWRFDTQVDIGNAGGEAVIEGKETPVDGTVMKCKGIAGLILLDRPVLLDEININLIEPGVLDKKLPVGDIIALVGDGQMDPDRFCTDAETEDLAFALNKTVCSLTLDDLFYGQWCSRFFHVGRMQAKRLAG